MNFIALKMLTGDRAKYLALIFAIAFSTLLREDQSLILYEQTVLTSLEEVENALVACGKEQEHHQALVQSEVANRRAVELAGERYRSGLMDFLNVLDTQRSLLSVQDDLARSDRTIGQNFVRLYKALGGGWQEKMELTQFKQTTR